MRDETVMSLCSERCNASKGGPRLSGPKWFDRIFRHAIVNSQIAQVGRPKILERMVSGSSLLLARLVVTSFLFKLRT